MVAAVTGPPRDPTDARTPADQSTVRHGIAFLLSGGVAFAVDACVLLLLTQVAHMPPILARLFAISVAMVAAWLMHRTYTFAVPMPPTLAEFVRYAGVAWTAAALNYAVFVLIVLLAPTLPPIIALIASSLVAMAFSYLGMRFGAFRAPRD